MPRLSNGEKMVNCDVVTAKGEETSLFALADGKPTVMLTLRHIGCPLTRLDIHEFYENYDEFVKKGVNLIIVVQSKPNIVMQTLGSKEFKFPIVCDEKCKIYEKLEIKPAKSQFHFMKGKSETKARKAMAKQAGFEEGEKEGNPLQLPAFFYFDRYRMVTECHYAEYLCDMPTVKQFTDNI